PRKTRRAPDRRNLSTTHPFGPTSDLPLLTCDFQMPDWTIISRSLRARLFSTVTTVITVGVAVALMLVLLTMRDSGRRAFERGSGNMHLLISRDASPLVSILNGVFYAGAPRAPLY